MKWDIFLLIVSVSILLLWAPSGYVVNDASAEAIAAKLAPQMGVKEDILQSNLADILERSRLRHAVVYGTPWAIFSILLTVRILANVVRKRRNYTSSGLNGKRIIQA
jgi:hypothetical protein